MMSLSFFLFLLLLNIDEEAVTAAVRLCREYNEQHHLLFDVNNTSSTIILYQKIFASPRFNRHLNGLNHFSTIILLVVQGVFLLIVATSSFNLQVTQTFASPSVL